MLLVDIGNSRIKWGQVESQGIKSHGVIAYNNNNFETQLESLNWSVQKDNVKVSCVAGSDIKLKFRKWVKKQLKVDTDFAATSSRQCGIINSYDVPESMGVDRWLAMIGAFQVCDIGKNEVICVVDCGTAITLDVINAAGQHQGGVILPGFKMMIKSLVKDTRDISGVEELSYRASLNEGLASSTHSAVAKGCAQLMIGGITSILDGVSRGVEGRIHCFITGGDGEWVAAALKCENTYHPLLVLQGLNITKAKGDEGEQ